MDNEEIASLLRAIQEALRRIEARQLEMVERERLATVGSPLVRTSTEFGRMSSSGGPQLYSAMGPIG